MHVALGNDHAGLPLKAHVRSVLAAASATVADYGTDTPEPVDFPDVAARVCAAVRSGEAERGLMVCGTGVGAAIAANKVPGIRASVSHDTYTARQGVEHDDVNVLCLGAQIVGPVIAAEVVRAFLSARFSTDEAFRRRVRKLGALEAAAAAEQTDTTDDARSQEDRV